jgi:hypothetical protein
MNEFPKTILSIKSILADLEANTNILSYELGYIKYKYNSADLRMFKQRILPAINKVCDNIDELRLVKLKANQLMADLMGQGKG